MPVRPIVLFNQNEAALRKKSTSVPGLNRRVRKLIRDLKDTLNERNDGIGLAAPQINVHSRVIVVRLGHQKKNDDEEIELDPPIALINPEIIEAKDEKRDFDGCLSFPGIFAETSRPHYLRVKGLDEKGKPFDRVFEGFDAVLIHHEIDHLDGVLFIDRVASPDDLYRFEENEKGEVIRVPISAAVRS